MALVLKRCRYSNVPDPDGRYIDILGRKSGILSWLLACLGVDPTTRFVVTGKELRVENSSLGGQHRVCVPLAKVSSAYCGFTRPWKTALALFGGGVSLGGTIAIFDFPFVGGMVCLLSVAVAFLWFWLNKRMTIGIYETGGRAHGIVFTRSVIEGVALKMEDAENMGLVINGLLRSNN